MKMFIKSFAFSVMLAVFAYSMWNLERWFNWKFGYKALDQELKVDWLWVEPKKPSHKHEFTYDSNVYFHPASNKKIVIGFREDGVVVWRDAATPKASE